MTELFETWIRQNKVLSFYFKAKKLIRYRWSIRVRRKCRVRRPAIGTASNTSPTGGPSSKDTWSSQICRNDCASSSSFPLLSFPSLSMSLQTEQHQTNKSITMVPLFSLSILQSIYSNWSSPNSEINHFEMHLYYLRNKFVWIYVASGIHKKKPLEIDSLFDYFTSVFCNRHIWNWSCSSSEIYQSKCISFIFDLKLFVYAAGIHIEQEWPNFLDRGPFSEIWMKVRATPHNSIFSLSCR